VRINQRTVDGKLTIQRSILEVVKHSPKEPPPDQLRLETDPPPRHVVLNRLETPPVRARQVPEDESAFGELPPSVE